MATRKLGNDETYMKRYSDLSRGAKQQQDLDRRAALKKAQAEYDAGDSASFRVGDAIAKLSAASPLNPRANSDIGDISARAAMRERKRSDALKQAQDDANYEDVKREGDGMFGRYYGDNVPGKAYKKGGRVTGYKGYGKAKKV